MTVGHGLWVCKTGVPLGLPEAMGSSGIEQRFSVFKELQNPFRIPSHSTGLQLTSPTHVIAVESCILLKNEVTLEKPVMILTFNELVRLLVLKNLVMEKRK